MTARHIDRVVADEEGQLWSERWLATEQRYPDSLVMMILDKNGQPAKTEVFALVWRNKVIG